MNFIDFINESNLIQRRIETDRVFDIQYPGRETKSGVKLSILGKTTDDVVFLFNSLSK